jgi:hypothetical protein
MKGAPSRVEANDVTLRVDTAWPSGCGTRDINVGEGARVKQEAMSGGPDTVEADDVTLGVDTAWQSE